MSSHRQNSVNAEAAILCTKLDRISSRQGDQTNQSPDGSWYITASPFKVTYEYVENYIANYKFAI